MEMVPKPGSRGGKKRSNPTWRHAVEQAFGDLKGMLDSDQDRHSHIFQVLRLVQRKSQQAWNGMDGHVGLPQCDFGEPKPFWAVLSSLVGTASAMSPLGFDEIQTQAC